MRVELDRGGSWGVGGGATLDIFAPLDIQLLSDDWGGGCM